MAYRQSFRVVSSPWKVRFLVLKKFIVWSFPFFFLIVQFPPFWNLIITLLENMLSRFVILTLLNHFLFLTLTFFRAFHLVLVIFADLCSFFSQPSWPSFLEFLISYFYMPHLFLFKGFKFRVLGRCGSFVSDNLVFFGFGGFFGKSRGRICFWNFTIIKDNVESFFQLSLWTDDYWLFSALFFLGFVWTVAGFL